jgi:threonine synthase
VAVSDNDLLAAQRKLASQGIWVEPASAAGVAGLLAEVQAGTIEIEGKEVVAICTGHGLKDPEAITGSFKPPQKIEAGVDALAAALSP